MPLRSEPQSPLSTGKLHSDKTYRYLAGKFDCDPCPLKHKCCSKTPSRKVPRTPYEETRDHARSPMEAEAYDRSRDRRKKIERFFGEAKHNLALTRLRLRGLTAAKGEFLMTATVRISNASPNSPPYRRRSPYSPKQCTKTATTSPDQSKTAPALAGSGKEISVSENSRHSQHTKIRVFQQPQPEADIVSL